MSGGASKYDVAIVGAGPAGASATIGLARSGRSVLLIDKRTFPRDKVCGGCLSGDALRLLRGLLGGSVGLPGAATKEIRFIVGRHRFICRPEGQAWLVARSQLDERLVRVAEDAGATTRFGIAGGLELADDRWIVRLGQERIESRTILLASGIGTLAERIGIRGRPCRRRLVAQQWIQPAAAPLPALGEIEMHWLRGGYIGLATPTAGQCVIAMAAESDSQSGESVFERLRRLNPNAPIMRALPPDAPRTHGGRGIGTFPWLPERLSDRNLLLIGDAAGYAEPFTGEGIGQALCSAECALRAIVESRDPAAAYDQNMKRRHAAVLRRTRTVGSMLRWPLVHVLARAVPWVPSSLFAWAVRHIHVRSPEREPSSRWLPIRAREARPI
jgi:flavin-dependent dehydrogenase